MKSVISNYDKANHYYNIKCRICDKEIKSPSLTNIVFSWLKKLKISQIRSEVRTVDSKSINTGSNPVSGAKLENINANQFDLSKICVILYIVENDENNV